MFTLTYVDLEYETSISVWEFEFMIVLKNRFAFISARYTIKFDRNKWNCVINELRHIDFYMNIGNSNWHNWSFDPTKMNFLTLFSSLYDYWHPSTRIALVQTSWGEMEGCEKRAIQLLKIRKMKVSRNSKTKCVTDILLTVRSLSMKDYTCHYVEST